MIKVHKPKQEKEVDYANGFICSNDGCRKFSFKVRKDCQIHKPDKKKSNSVLQQSSDSSTSFLGEKQLMVCKTCRKLSFDLKEKNSKDLVAELRSKNPYKKNIGQSYFYRDKGWDACCDELEKMLKEERK